MSWINFKLYAVQQGHQKDFISFLLSTFSIFMEMQPSLLRTIYM